MDTLRVRAYNVQFGDAILITVPDRDPAGKVTRRSILIDVGNALGEGGPDDIFEPVVKDILTELDGQPLDLYIMTHEHMDHVQGLLYAENKFFAKSSKSLKSRLRTRYAWLTASAAKDYYKDHPKAREKHIQALEARRQIAAYFGADGAGSTPYIEALLAVNNPRSTADCVTYLSKLAGSKKTFYLSRGAALAGHHNFSEARLEIWAPEDDTSEYYGKFQPMALGLSQPQAKRARPTLTPVEPPQGVDASIFYNLVESRKNYADNLLAIDKAANNTSLVFCLEWRGWRLLFPGDAEERSWKKIAEHGLLKPVHFLKVSHHGSENGTPGTALLDQLLPIHPAGDKPRRALFSTWADVYNDVPHPPTLAAIKKRCNQIYELDKLVPPGGCYDIFFEG